MTKVSWKACCSRISQKLKKKKRKKKKERENVILKYGVESQNSPLPLFYCSEPALPAVRLGGNETRPLVAASDRFQSPPMLCPSQITIHFWLPRFSSVWIQNTVWESLTSAMFLSSVCSQHDFHEQHIVVYHDGYSMQRGMQIMIFVGSQ